MLYLFDAHIDWRKHPKTCFFFFVLCFGVSDYDDI